MTKVCQSFISFHFSLRIRSYFVAVLSSATASLNLEQKTIHQMPALRLLFREPLFHLLTEQNRGLGQAVGCLEEASSNQGDDSIRTGLTLILERDMELRDRLTKRLCDTLMTPIGHGDAMRLASELGCVLRDVSLATHRFLDHGPAGQPPIVELVAVVRECCGALSRRYTALPGCLSPDEPMLEFRLLRRRADRLATRALAATYGAPPPCSSVWEREQIGSLRSAAYHAKQAAEIMHQAARHSAVLKSA